MEMENKYLICGDDSGLTASKNLENDSIEITLTPLIRSWNNETEMVDVEIEIVSAMYYTYNSQHPIVLNEKMEMDLDEQVAEYVNKNIDSFDYDFYSDENYQPSDFASEINHKGNE